jgi:hypothetical protein
MTTDSDLMTTNLTLNLKNVGSSGPKLERMEPQWESISCNKIEPSCTKLSAEVKLLSKLVQPEIRSSHSVFVTPVHDAVLFGHYVPKFRRTVAPSSSGSRGPTKTAWLWYEDTNNIGIYTLIETATHPKRNNIHFLYFHSSLLWNTFFGLMSIYERYILSPIWDCDIYSALKVLLSSKPLWRAGTIYLSRYKVLLRNIYTCINVFKITSSLWHIETKPDHGGRVV